MQTSASAKIDVADIIRSAASSTLGVLALLCVLVAALAYYLFRSSSDKIKLFVFFPFLLAAVSFGGVALYESAGQQRKNASDTSLQSGVIDASKFLLSGVKMAFVVAKVSEHKIDIVNETIVPVFQNLNSFPVVIQFDTLSISVNGVQAPPVPPDDMTIEIPAHDGPFAWYGSQPHIKAGNGDTLNGYINASLTYSNQDHRLKKKMTIRGRVVARIPKEGRIVTIEWWPEPDSERAAAQALYKYVPLAPQIPFSEEDKAVLNGSAPPRL